jgi:hypothetical protein
MLFAHEGHITEQAAGMRVRTAAVRRRTSTGGGQTIKRGQIQSDDDAQGDALLERETPGCVRPLVRPEIDFAAPHVPEGKRQGQPFRRRVFREQKRNARPLQTFARRIGRRPIMDAVQDAPYTGMADVPQTEKML